MNSADAPARTTHGRLPAQRAGNNLDSIRRHNLSTILQFVHHAGPVPRSELTRKTGLNRSTVGALVGELAELGLVLETSPDSSNGVGRPSAVVRPNPATVAIAVNPEIDAVTVGAVSLGGVVQKRIRYETDKAPSVREAVNISAAIIEGMKTDGTRIAGIGVAVPGLVRTQDGLVRLAPHLEWTDEPIAEMLATATGYPVKAANDASLGALAERTFGAARRVSDLIYLNGGASGIGGGIISGGHALTGVAGHAGELGHTRIRSGGGLDTARARGTLESEVTRDALLAALGLASADVDELEEALLSSTSAKVRAVVDRQQEYLAIALGNAINILNPELIILGGFLGSLHAADPERLERLVSRESLPVSHQSVHISRPQLGANLLMVGAAELVFADLLADPAAYSFVA